jgi:hypothetical protein
MPLRQPDNQLTLTGKSPSQTDQDCISSLLSEALLRVDIPTREEVRSIDESSQIYQDGGVLGNDCKSYPARAKRRAPV